MNDFNMRINEYPFDTQIISVCPIDYGKKCECELIREFKSEFNFRSDIENENFKGNEKDMISVFNGYCSEYLPNRDEVIDMDYFRQIEDRKLVAEPNQRRYKKY
jgi:hypothetical protein